MLAVAAFAAPDTRREQDFTAWRDEFRGYARRRGISETTLERTIDTLTVPSQMVIQRDRTQPEFNLSLAQYMSMMVNEARVQKGRQMYRENRVLLERIRNEYGVPPQYILAFWALESNFGTRQGTFPVVPSIATLAFDGRRGAFFREELISALWLIDRGHIPHDVKGSWAGAMGNFQFIPSSYRRYAVDFNNDGRRDLFNSKEDSFASAANFLKRKGWQEKQRWGREVKVQNPRRLNNVNLRTARTVTEWKRLGITAADGKPLPDSQISARLLLPEGINGVAFLVYPNFDVIMRWNRSTLYALAVGHLADRIAWGGQLMHVRGVQFLQPPELEQLQELLKKRGFYEGEIDGKKGPLTIAAVVNYQQQNNIPVDGFASKQLLNRLRREEIEELQNENSNSNPSGP